MIEPGGGPTSLDGDHTFSRFNPAAGVTFSPSRTLNLYGGYSEGSRAATSIELGCANPDEPCKLPNALAGDPPLDQVVTRTWEGGARGVYRGVNWSAGVFRADLSPRLVADALAALLAGFVYRATFDARAATPEALRACIERLVVASLEVPAAQHAPESGRL